MSKSSTFDLAVIGAGIAGLAIAEIFARSGLKVALLEKNDVVCQEASGSHHEWFHFGSLYSIFPNNQFMRTLVGGIDDLLKYNSSFSSMNISIGREGKLKFGKGMDKWIRDEPIEYIVSARNDRDFSLGVFDGSVNYAKKLFFLLTWEYAIKQFIARHQRFHKFNWNTGPASNWIPKAGWFDYSREVISSVMELEAIIDKNTHFRVPGFDRPMNATVIIKELLQSFLSQHGVLRLNCRVNGTVQTGKGAVTVKLDGEELFARKVCFTSGRNINQFMGNELKFKIVASPLLVVYPKICKQNFVRLTPFVDKSVNHLVHYANGEPYSVIGGGYFADADNPAAIEDAKIQLQRMAERVFPNIANAKVRETYIGYKTEILATGKERNYLYQVRKINDDMYVAVPGKFSLAFSLARHTHKKLLGYEPCQQVNIDPNINVSSFIAPIRHRQIIMDYMNLIKMTNCAISK